MVSVPAGHAIWDVGEPALQHFSRKEGQRAGVKQHGLSGDWHVRSRRKGSVGPLCSFLRTIRSIANIAE